MSEKKKKRIKNILILPLLAIVSLIMGYTIFIPGHATKDNAGNNPIAIMLDQGNGNYVESTNTSFTQDGYEFDHAQCLNGSVVTEKEDGISVKFTGSDHCTLYYSKASDLSITSIKVNGSAVSSVPQSVSYTVTPTCIGATATWNYTDWSLDISSPTKSSIKCSLEFNTPNSYNYLHEFLNTNKNTTQGATSAKGQLVNEKGVRYEGTDPYNYVSFNGELWRIIGMFAFDKSTNVEVNGGSTDCSTYNCYTKIIRNDSIGAFAFSALGISTSTARNYWVTTSGGKCALNILLNTYYYNHTDGTGNSACSKFGNSKKGADCDFTKRGIQDSYKSMVREVVWNLGGSNDSVTTQAIYGNERGTNTPGGNAATASGYIGLMYPSDYGYSVLASDGSTTCSRTGVNLSAYGVAECGGKSWLLKNATECTITPAANTSSYGISIYMTGSIITSQRLVSGSYKAHSVRPVLYLTNKVYIVSGTGTESNPYILGLDISN